MSQRSCFARTVGGFYFLLAIALTPVLIVGGDELGYSNYFQHAVYYTLSLALNMLAYNEHNVQYFTHRKLINYMQTGLIL
jgi:hypothetical protein